MTTNLLTPDASSDDRIVVRIDCTAGENRYRGIVFQYRGGCSWLLLTAYAGPNGEWDWSPIAWDDEVASQQAAEAALCTAIARALA